jgi:uncharacterized protein
MRHVHGLRRLVVAGVLLLAALAVPGARPVLAAPGDSTAPDLGRPQAYVTDDAGILEAGEEARIERYLGKVERELGVQFALITVQTTQPQTIEEFAVRQFERWGIGGKKLDEGLLLVVAFADRKVRFEVGYGLEGTLPDGRVGGIIREQIRPAMREGRYGDGLLAGLVEAARFVAGEKGLPPPLPDDGPAPQERRERTPPRLVFILFLVILLMLMALGRGGGGGRRGRRHGPVIFTTGGWGGGFGGGFGGGGFGGGASGGGFGGFGGGASGGGGATGSW